jgi:hypothetical protein
LVEASKRHPVSGNAEGSYLTMQSKEGAVFFVINIVGNFGTVSPPYGVVIGTFYLGSWRDSSPLELAFSLILQICLI